MKKRILITICILLSIIILIPIPQYLDDGGTIIYKSIMYEVSKVHSLTTIEEMEKGKEHNEGLIIRILGIEIYNNVK